MMVKKIYRLLLLSGLALVCNNCVEEFDFGTQNFEDILVVDARITDELKFQKVALSRTFRLENEGPAPEIGASVSVTDDRQNVFQFSETTEGQYISNEAFAAESGVNYQLQITTLNGKSYASRAVTLPQPTPIDELYVERIINDDGEEGVGFFVDSFDPTGNAFFYRYEYEETYQIIPPFWFDLDIKVISRDPPEIDVVSREREERICYKNEFSNRIIINETTSLSENRVERFMVQFLASSDLKLRDRYSILVKQFVQTPEAHEFFDTLSNFSDLESLFSQLQPGFIVGNILSVENPNENVLGFFELTPISEKRVFVNRRDFFPESTKPDYPANCSFFEESEDEPLKVIDAVENRGLKLISVGAGFIYDQYTFTFKICSDCNVLGSNVRPDFWVD
ncbi:DUF4249 domain-containing protein [Aquimarina spongiae]|uniref:DUF4249 domain-containing protein n=1 Tax=Aquimarina spongiae TaxID=570521 RepID=A0A1M6G9I8_9FLAO|nr:DUF4249 domain-containing protein [Aquimarina spongiae]SHJ06626.1 protein of unknown function [Aquimarina spongiae]